MTPEELAKLKLLLDETMARRNEIIKLQQAIADYINAITVNERIQLAAYRKENEFLFRVLDTIGSFYYNNGGS
jgi:hypothetical protein